MVGSSTCSKSRRRTRASTSPYLSIGHCAYKRLLISTRRRPLPGGPGSRASSRGSAPVKASCLDKLIYWRDGKGQASTARRQTEGPHTEGMGFLEGRRRLPPDADSAGELHTLAGSANTPSAPHWRSGV